MEARVDDDFTKPAFRAATLDKFIPRQAILSALLEQLPSFQGTVLDLGCGRMPYKGLVLAAPSRARQYIGMDLKDNIYGKPDLAWDGRTIPLDSNSVECAMATEVFEHCPDPQNVMCEILRVLKPRGRLFFTVPFLWPLHDSPHDEYRFTPFALDRHLRNARFDQIKMKALGGWDASLAQMIGLWVRRRPMNKYQRRILSILARPLISYLLRRDHPPGVDTDQTMITGIAGSAVKPCP